MKKFAALLVAMMLLLTATAALAELKAGCNPEFIPFEFMDDNGVIVGFDADFAAELSKDIGEEIVLEATAFDSIVPGIASGMYDLGISGFYITEERLVNVDFSEPYLEDGQTCVVKVDSGIVTADDLSGKAIGSQNGTIGIDTAEEFTDKVYSYAKVLDAMMELQGGKLDAVITDTPVANRLLKEINDPSLVALDVEFGTELYGVAIPKGNTELKAKIDASIARMVEDGTLDALVVKWDIYGENVGDEDAAN